MLVAMCMERFRTESGNDLPDSKLIQNFKLISCERPKRLWRRQRPVR